MTIPAFVTIFPFIMKLYKVISVISLFLTVACSGATQKGVQSTYPKSPEDVRRERAGHLFGDKGFNLFGGKSGESSGKASGIAINSYLWRASLDTLSFMPLASADPFGGVIITDWYEDPDARGERFKVNVYILSSKLRSDAIKVSVFKQSKKSGSWSESNLGKDVAQSLENTILTRARELKVEKDSR